MDYWKPLNHNHDEALYDGIPDFMLESLIDWVIDAEFKMGVAEMEPSNRADFIHEFDRLDKFPSGLSTNGTATVFQLNSKQNPNLLLNYIDFILCQLGNLDDGEKTRQDIRGEIHELINDLDTILSQSGSKWRVGERRGHVGLVERVNPSMDKAADKVMRESGDAGDLLAKAWHELFGRNPNPSLAYSTVVKALELATNDYLSPNDSKYTLGKGLSVMREQHWGYQIDITEQLNNAPHHTVDGGVIQLMMRSIWESQRDRHAGNGITQITAKEARAAIFLAVPIIQAFNDGLVSKPDQQS